MESNFAFNLQEKINQYFEKIFQPNSLTESDRFELENHLLDQMDELKAAGLDEEEAFIIASRRLDLITDMESNFAHVNDNVLQLRKTTTILAGVLLYFFLYYFVLFSSKSFLIVLELIKHSPMLNIQRMINYLVCVHFVIIFLTATIFFFEKKVINIIGRLNIKPKHTFWLLIITFFLGVILNKYLD